MIFAQKNQIYRYFQNKILFVMLTIKGLYNMQMNQYHNINEGVYLVQQGHRNNIAIIQCPYVHQKIQVYDADGLKIIHGAQVYWTQIRRHHLSKRKGNREIINAVVVGIKHCDYLCNGKSVIFSLKISSDGQKPRIQGIPVNKKLPIFDIIDSPEIQDINFSQPEIIKTYEKKYYWGRFMNWQYTQQFPKGQITGLFSHEYKTPEVQGDILLHLLQIELQKSSLVNPKSILKNKQYLPIKDHIQFKNMMFTIDPPNSKDNQDGLSLEVLRPGFYQVGVHIADVTSYKHLINRKEIATKGTSIYLPHKTIHMMPPEIVEMLAFKSKKKRLSFSVFLKLNDQGQILQTRFQKTIVKNTAQLTYQQAQNIIDDKIDEDVFMTEKHINSDEFHKLKEKLLILKKLAFNRRKSRCNSDIFDKNEVVFQLDEKNVPINIGIKKRLQTQKIVEEFMILTNCQVANKLVKDFGSNALISYHSKPSNCNITYLNDYVSQLGVKFKADKADNMIHFQNQFRQLFDKKELDDGIKQILLLKAIKIQQYAIYTRYLNTYKGHYGLNLQNYTHFTSPLRRFADIIVHQQLERCIKNQPPLKMKQIADLQAEIQLINLARAKNKKIKQLIVECFINLYLYSKNQKIKTKGYIIQLGLKSATIFVPQYNLIKQVDWKGDASYVDKDRIQYVVKNKEQTITKIFQKNECINVQMNWQIHHEVQLNLIIECNNKKIKI